MFCKTYRNIVQGLSVSSVLYDYLRFTSSATCDHMKFLQIYDTNHFLINLYIRLAVIINTVIQTCRIAPLSEIRHEILTKLNLAETLK